MTVSSLDPTKTVVVDKPVLLKATAHEPGEPGATRTWRYKKCARIERGSHGTGGVEILY